MTDNAYRWKLAFFFSFGASIAFVLMKMGVI